MIICLKISYGHKKMKLGYIFRVKRGSEGAFGYLPQKKKTRMWMQ